MKNHFKLFFAVALVIAIAPKSFAIDITNNYQGYVIKDKQYEKVEMDIKNVLSQHSFKTKQIENVPNAYYEITPKDEHYYLRFYPAYPDTNIYIVSEKPVNMSENPLSKTMDKLSYSYEILKDKQALKEYKFDFIELARSGTFEGFFLLPDCIKPIKKTVSNVNKFVNKKHKKKTIAKYSPDDKSINLTLVDKKEYNDKSAGITIISNEYRLNQKSNKYVHAFEYMIYNKTNNPITLKKVSGESVASLRDVETSALSDLDKINLLDSAGSLLAVPTAGASLALKIPNFTRVVKMTKEAKRYTKGLPENKVIEQNSSMRILTLKFKTNPKPLIFTFDSLGQEYKIEF